MIRSFVLPGGFDFFLVSLNFNFNLKSFSLYETGKFKKRIVFLEELILNHSKDFDTSGVTFGENV